MNLQEGFINQMEEIPEVVESINLELFYTDTSGIIQHSRKLSTPLKQAGTLSKDELTLWIRDHRNSFQSYDVQYIGLYHIDSPNYTHFMENNHTIRVKELSLQTIPIPETLPAFHEFTTLYIIFSPKQRKHKKHTTRKIRLLKHRKTRKHTNGSGNVY